MAILSFISDEKLLEYTKEVLDRAAVAEAAAEANIYTNVVDPFSAMFDALRQGVTMDEWFKQEQSRQIQKTLQNALGDFHQNILGSMSGWRNAGKGGSYDIINDEKHIIAEIKNKHNTMNSSSAEAAYSKLSNHLRFGEKGYTAYLVTVIPKSPRAVDAPWSPNLTIMQLREDIRRIDGKSFYDLASNTSGALLALYDALPKIIATIAGTPTDAAYNSTMFMELFTRAYD